jgi:hypothetical protein
MTGLECLPTNPTIYIFREELVQRNITYRCLFDCPSDRFPNISRHQINHLAHSSFRDANKGIHPHQQITYLEPKTMTLVASEIQYPTSLNPIMVYSKDRR